MFMLTYVSIFCVLHVCLGSKAVLLITYVCGVAAITARWTIEHMECKKAFKDLVMQHMY